MPEMSVRQANALKRTRRCLKCGRLMWTDRCHRICTKCGHSNERLLEVRAATPQDVRHLLRAAAGQYSHGSGAAATLAIALED